MATSSGDVPSVSAISGSRLLYTSPPPVPQSSDPVGAVADELAAYRDPEGRTGSEPVSDPGREGASAAALEVKDRPLRNLRASAYMGIGTHGVRYGGVGIAADLGSSLSIGVGAAAGRGWWGSRFPVDRLDPFGDD